MSFTYEEKQSSSPYVDVVWRTEDQTDGVYIASADACWDMVFIKSYEGKRNVLLSGPSSNVTFVPYSAGNKNFGIRFKLGTIFTNIPVTGMVNITKALPMPTEDTFVLQGFTWKLPTYEKIDEFLARLMEDGLLSMDPVVRDILEHKAVNMSVRSIQRHFAMTIGFSPRRVKQIVSARRAVALLLHGLPPAEVSYQLGYADLPHMIRMLKRFTGYTPIENKHRGEQV
jgi:AraC-like DNA-binding protein